MPLEFAILASIASITGISASTLKTSLIEARKKYNEKKQSENHEMRLLNYAKITKAGLTSKILRQYYLMSRPEKAKELFYSFSVNGTIVETQAITRDKWISSPFELRANMGDYKLVKKELSTAVIHEKQVAKLLAILDQRDLELWNENIYRLVDFNLNDNNVEMVFALSEFFDYRFSIGLLNDELYEGIIEAGFDINRALESKLKYFPLREQFLPSINEIFKIGERMCVGGIAVFFAMARSEPYNDFVFLIQIRSDKVGECQNMISLIPRAFHQPMINEYQELNVFWTVYRELFEELLEGEEVTKGVTRVFHDWYIEECNPLKLLYEGKSKNAMECITFGFNPLPGNYDIGVSWIVEDTDFWEIYGRKMRGNWEAKGVKIISSKDSKIIADLLTDPQWTSEVLLVLSESLLALKAKYPDKVDLPEIVRLSP